jgi:hypothetical protein
MTTRRAYKNQIYELVGERPYVNRKGETIMLAAWSTVCCDCGVETEVMTRGAEDKKFEPLRRCRKCVDVRRAKKMVSVFD